MVIIIIITITTELFSLRVISLLDIICSKVHFHTWNFQLAQQEAVQGRVHRVVTSFSIIIMLKSVTFNLAGVVKIIYLVTARSDQQMNIIFT